MANTPPDRMSSDSTERFSVRADYYSKYRPGYPAEIVEVLQREIGFGPDETVADIGSGTGLLAKAFLQYGNRVYGVEPNARMRFHAERNLAGFPNFLSVKGTAEHTTLPAESINLVTVGQALHWFDPVMAAKEFARVSKPKGHLCVVYNEMTRRSKFMRSLHLLTVRNEDPRRDVPNADTQYASRFFDRGRFSKIALRNEQLLDFDGLMGRLLSASHMPSPRDRGRVGKLKRDVTRLFDTNQSGGQVKLVYDTKVYVGRISYK